MVYIVGLLICISLDGHKQWTFSEIELLYIRLIAHPFPILSLGGTTYLDWPYNKKFKTEVGPYNRRFFYDF